MCASEQERSDEVSRGTEHLPAPSPWRRTCNVPLPAIAEKEESNAPDMIEVSQTSVEIGVPEKMQAISASNHSLQKSYHDNTSAPEDHILEDQGCLSEMQYNNDHENVLPDTEITSTLLTEECNMQSLAPVIRRAIMCELSDPQDASLDSELILTREPNNNIPDAVLYTDISAQTVLSPHSPAHGSSESPFSADLQTNSVSNNNNPAGPWLTLEPVVSGDLQGHDELNNLPFINTTALTDLSPLTLVPPDAESHLAVFDFNPSCDIFESVVLTKDSPTYPKASLEKLGILENTHEVISSEAEDFSDGSGDDYEPKSEEESSSDSTDNTTRPDKESSSLSNNDKSHPDEESSSESLDDGKPGPGAQPHQHGKEVPAAHRSGNTLARAPSSPSKPAKEKKNVPVKQRLNTKGVKVSLARKASDTKRVWDKKHYCTYCQTLVFKLPRHLETFHSEEKEVAHLLAFPKGSKERAEKITALRNRGYFQYNVSVLRKGDGELLVKKRPATQTTPSKYLPCEYCGVLYSRDQMAVHQRKCSQKPSTSKDAEEGHKRPNRHVRARCALLLPSAPESRSGLKEKIFQAMQQDEIYNLIIRDPLIVAYAESLYDEYGHIQKHHRMIKDKCRELGRFMKAIKSLDPSIRVLSDLMTPSKYNLIRDGVRKVAGFDSIHNVYTTPSLAIKLGMSIKSCASVYRGMCMDDDVQRNLLPEIGLFLEKMEIFWTKQVSKRAHGTLYERKWNAPAREPLAKDITLLNKYLADKNQLLVEEVKENPANLESYQQLTEVALCRLLILNRRRVGEIQFMRKEDYLKRSSVDEHSPAFQSLSESEKVLATILKRVEIRGKKGRKVPVLLTQELQLTIELLLEYRDAHVDTSNTYLFSSLKNESGHYRADVLLRKFAHACGAEHPEFLTGTRLRKHVATMSQMLNLRDNELDALATFMGHDIRVHRQYYRLADHTMDLAKLGKIFISMDKGTFANMKGKNLDEITLDDAASGEEDQEDDETVVDAPSEGQSTAVDGDINVSASRPSKVKSSQGARQKHRRPAQQRIHPQAARTKNKEASESEDSTDDAANDTERSVRAATKRPPLQKRPKKLNSEDSAQTSSRAGPEDSSNDASNDAEAPAAQKRPPPKISKQVNISNPSSVGDRPKPKRRAWPAADIAAIKGQFKGHLGLKQAPSKEECLRFLKSNPTLCKERSWKDIKFCVKNMFYVRKPKNTE